MKKLLILLLGISVFPFSAFADDPDPFTVHERLDSIIVSAHRVDSKTPVAHSTVEKQALKGASAESSIPTILELLPSVVATTEGGTGLGYSRITIRGNDATRTNVTFNGVTINDAESQQVFWVNLPTLQRYLNSVEVQRGIGTSSAGTGAFGASVNMESNPASDRFNISTDLSYGSFNTFVGSVFVSTGKTANGFGADAAYSYSHSDGFLRGGWSNLNSGFVTMSKEGKKHNFTLLYLIGNQRTGITWNGVTAEEIARDRRFNPAGMHFDENRNVVFYENESDNYQQQHVQLHHKYVISPNWNVVSTLNYTRGDGFYENYHQELAVNNLFRDSVTRSNMGNNYYVLMSTVNYIGNRLRMSASLNGSVYGGNHWGTVIWKNYSTAPSPELYRNNSFKADYGGFVNARYNLTGRLVAWGDLQFRHIDYNLRGLLETGDIDYSFKYNFVNPKAGLLFNINSRNTLYASVAIGHKEPSRTDILEAGGDIKPETMFDYELGYRLALDRFSFEGNIYLMEYKDQLVTTGKIDADGYMIKENVDKSFRRGVELAAGWAPVRFFRLDANATFSINKVVGIGDLSYSPSAVAMAQMTLFPSQGSYIKLSGKYIGKQYCDNQSTEEYALPAYFVSNLECGLKWKTLEFNLNVNNLFNAKYVSYGYAGGYYFPQPGTNFSFAVRFSLK
ncbi:MAG: TonB-dependent receptor [Bacteroidales bacterium]|nr:TonB-dependent receptor [Bacteroidales bacterium]